MMLEVLTRWLRRRPLATTSANDACGAPPSSVSASTRFLRDRIPMALPLAAALVPARLGEARRIAMAAQLATRPRMEAVLDEWRTLDRSSAQPGAFATAAVVARSLWQCDMYCRLCFPVTSAARGGCFGTRRRRSCRRSLDLLLQSSRRKALSSLLPADNCAGSKPAARPLHSAARLRNQTTFELSLVVQHRFC
jgi:hypothetical protein